MDGDKKKFECSGECGLSVRLKLKHQKDKNYIVTEDPEIKALVFNNDVTFKQAFPGASSPDLLLYYDLTRKDNMSMENWEKTINEFLATGKFENEVYEYGIAHPG